MKRILFAIIGFATLMTVDAQNPSLEKEVAAYRKADSLSAPRLHTIVFAGSSSFRLWKNIKSDFAGYPVVNRGFGGSTLVDLRHWLHDLVLVHQPKQVIIYCGENDLAESDTVTGKIVAERFKDLFTDLRSWMPGVPVAYVSMKPSPSRAHLFPKMKEGNTLIRDFLATQTAAIYINVYDAMLSPDGSAQKEFFVEDMLHMNENGYAIWRKLITPHLLKD